MVSLGWKIFIAGAVIPCIVVILVGAYLMTDLPKDDGDDAIVQKDLVFADQDFTLDIRLGDVEGFPQGWFRTLGPEANGKRFVTPDDPTIVKLWSVIAPMMEGMTDLEKAKSLLRFVQDATYYEYDIYAFGMRDYVQYPAETLYRGFGDCEDVSYLLYTLYAKAGLDAVILSTSDHVSVGVNVEGAVGNGYKRLLSDDIYYIAEATGSSSIGKATLDGSVPWVFKPTDGFSVFLITAGTSVIVLVSVLTLNMRNEGTAIQTRRAQEVSPDAQGL